MLDKKTQQVMTTPKRGGLERPVRACCLLHLKDAEII